MYVCMHVRMYACTCMYEMNVCRYYAYVSIRACICIDMTSKTDFTNSVCITFASLLRTTLDACAGASKFMLTAELPLPALSVPPASLTFAGTSSLTCIFRQLI